MPCSLAPWPLLALWCSQNHRIAAGGDQASGRGGARGGKQGHLAASSGDSSLTSLTSRCNVPATRRRPAGVVLAAASAAAWPLLAVAAAAYGRAPPLQCLAAYLNATLARHAADAQVRVPHP